MLDAIKLKFSLLCFAWCVCQQPVKEQLKEVPKQEMISCLQTRFTNQLTETTSKVLFSAKKDLQQLDELALIFTKELQHFMERCSAQQWYLDV